MLIEAAMYVIIMTAMSLFIQDKFNIPSPISLIGGVLLFKFFGIQMIDMNNQTFDQIIILLLPILISVDALSLKLSDVKKHGLSLFYVAFLMVFLSVIAAVSLNQWILPDYNLSTPAIVALFCMIMATDPVSVSSVFGKVELPHNLKIIAEGESLFNDASALIIFSIALAFLNPESHLMQNITSISGIFMHGTFVIIGAIFSGILVGFLGLTLLKMTNNSKVETAIMLAISFTAYMFAEHFHWSGILAVIVSVLTANHVITSRIEKDMQIIEAKDKVKNIKAKFLAKFNDALEDKKNHEMVLSNIQYISVIGTTILFVSMAQIMNIDLLVTFWKEILSVFVATTLIRMLMLAKFSVLSNSLKGMHNISFHWWTVLCASGVKGAFSILMLHMLPSNFEHRDLFEAVVVGNVVLTTFIYPVILIAIIKIYKTRFKAECLAEQNH